MAKDRTIQGTAVSPGLALGPVHVVQADPEKVPTWSVGKEGVPQEVGRLAQAVQVASQALERRQEQVAKEVGEKDAEIFAVHRMILQDPTSLRQVETMIVEDLINAESAVQSLIRRFEAMTDVSDPWRHVLDALLRGDREAVLSSQEKVILAAHELTPKVMTFVERERVLGVVTETGGRFSHGAVLARSFGVPCVVGVANLVSRLEQGLLVAVDGDLGQVQLRPDQEQVDQLLVRKQRLEDRFEALRANAGLPAETIDGHRIDVQVNLESVRDLEMFDIGHCDGLGLLRTEFLYMERPEFPSEEEQYRLYRRILAGLGPLPAVLRALDIGGDKPLPYFHTPNEPNPALGWRGIRITLEWRDLLRVQLRAFLRASSLGDLRILLPMVTSLEEIQDVYQVFCEVRDELGEQGYEVGDNVPVGVMIEVPSMLFCLDDVLEQVDFVSVGTNDLVQYLLAADRDNPWVSRLYEPQHPAVLRALNTVAKAARQHNKPASVCGDLAGDPAMAVLLVGMGFHAVSVASHFLGDMKYAVRSVTYAEASEFADQALAQISADGVKGVLSRVRERLYDEKVVEPDTTR
ncbi:MAG: phosphoenolpyruvate--protein phosphotransferase [Planctomycetota bacterium]